MNSAPKDVSLTKVRCPWSLKDPLYISYHDTEWGVPIYDDQKLFEFLFLEGMQAGLSWLTILRKREAFRQAFDQFDATKIVRYQSSKVEELLGNAAIIRSRSKITSAISNAAAFLKIVEEFGSFASYNWSFMDRKKPRINHWDSLQNLPATTPESIRFSNDLKKRGFKFVGPTIMYAHMQASGMVNDHLTSCFRHQELCHDPTMSV